MFAVVIMLAAAAFYRVDAAASAATPKFASAIYSPQPKYPPSAGLRFAHGTGMFVLRIQIKTGRVKQVDVVRSTGHKDLDAAAVAALKQWRFKPDALPPIKKIDPHRKDPFEMEDSFVKVPVTFEVRW
jgi:periplasmic protein TonB